MMPDVLDWVPCALGIGRGMGRDELGLGSPPENVWIWMCVHCYTVGGASKVLDCGL